MNWTNTIGVFKPPANLKKSYFNVFDFCNASRLIVIGLLWTGIFWGARLKKGMGKSRELYQTKLAVMTQLIKELSTQAIFSSSKWGGRIGIDADTCKNKSALSCYTKESLGLNTNRISVSVMKWLGRKIQQNLWKIRSVVWAVTIGWNRLESSSKTLRTDYHALKWIFDLTEFRKAGNINLLSPGTKMWH